MSFSKVIVMATTIALAILLMVSTAATTELNDGGETKKIEDMNLIPAPEGKRGMEGYWNKWKAGVEDFHFHFHFLHPHLEIPIPIPFPPLQLHGHHVDQPSPSPSSSAQPPAYTLP